jgi:2'-5' RNA ligase
VSESGEDTAVVVPVRLPAPLEGLRRRTAQEAATGLPAHLTMLYPFVALEALDDDLRLKLASILSPIDAFDYRLTERRRWPDTLYAAVEPEAPFRSMQSTLAAAFPEFPVYEGAFAFDPHVTVVWGPQSEDAGIADDPAWKLLPASRQAGFVDLIVRIDGRWRRRWRFPLRTPAGPAGPAAEDRSR